MSAGEITAIISVSFTVFCTFGSLVWWTGSKLSKMDSSVASLTEKFSELAHAWNGFVHGEYTTVPCTERDGRMDAMERRLEKHSSDIGKLQGKDRDLKAMDPTGEHTERVLRRHKATQRPAIEPE